MLSIALLSQTAVRRLITSRAGLSPRAGERSAARARTGGV